MTRPTNAETLRADLQGIAAHVAQHGTGIRQRPELVGALMAASRNAMRANLPAVLGRCVTARRAAEDDDAETVRVLVLEAQRLLPAAEVAHAG